MSSFLGTALGITGASRRPAFPNGKTPGYTLMLGMMLAFAAASASRKASI